MTLSITKPPPPTPHAIAAAVNVSMEEKEEEILDNEVMFLPPTMRPQFQFRVKLAAVFAFLSTLGLENFLTNGQRRQEIDP